MHKCKTCKYFRHNTMPGADNGECLLNPPVPFMVGTRNPIGDMIPGFVSGRPSTHEDDFCSHYTGQFVDNG